MEAQMEIKSKGNSNFELKKEKRSHRNFVGEIFAWTMKPHNCSTQKCQKLNQFVSSWTLTSKVAPNESHQQELERLLASPRDVVPLYFGK
jgi:hemerythrin